MTQKVKLFCGNEFECDVMFIGLFQNFFTIILYVKRYVQVIESNTLKKNEERK
jgi:hypothetical protein